jgi:hypothetical protein
MSAKLKTLIGNVPPQQRATTRKAVHLDAHHIIRVRAKTVWLNEEHLAITISSQISDSHKIGGILVVGEQRWFYGMS